MTRFDMFLKTPNGNTAVALLEEQQAYGPTGASFSENLVLRIRTGAPQNARQIFAVCDGFLRVSGVQDPTDTTAPLSFLLDPDPAHRASLIKMSKTRGMLSPIRFLLTGIDPASAQAALASIVDAVSVVIEPPAGKWQAFRDGSISLHVNSGQLLGSVGDSFSIQVQSEKFHLDPVALFAAMADDAEIELDGVDNSWLEVVNKNRVLISVRDEWDEPLIGESVVVIIAGNRTQLPLYIENQGTIILDNSQTPFTCEIPQRVLTRLPGLAGTGGEELLDYNVTAPIHIAIASINPDRWFHTQDPPLSDPTKSLFKYTAGNAVEPLIDGIPTYLRITNDLRAISNGQHFAFFAGWFFDVDFRLVPSDPSSTLRDLLNSIDQRGAKTRAMIWDNWAYAWSSTGGNPLLTASNLFRLLSNGSAVLDARTHHKMLTVPAAISPQDIDLYDPFSVFSLFQAGTNDTVFTPLKHVGSHHWKVTVIQNNEGLVAYLGGIDFNPDRLDDPDHQPATKPFHTTKPFHDVHCRIKGPAVYDVGKAFIDRWNDHPERPGGEMLSTSLLGNPPNAGTCMVQIARTYGATTQNYAPDGDRTIWATLQKAVSRAKKYIYIEDQYLTYMALSNELLSALDRIDHLMIVIDGVDGPGTQHPVKGYATVDKLRYQFLKPLYQKAPEKLHVYVLKSDDGMIKIHTKLVIIDDVFATIGSANMGRRSMTHDSEINAFVLDGAVESGARKFAHDLRIELWAEHLGWHRQMDRARMELGDISRAFEVILNSPPASARLHRYALDLGFDSYLGPTLIEDYFDPDGSEAPT